MPEQPFGEAYGGTPPVNYERYFVPAIGAPLAADLVRAAELRPGERVLDVACGTGIAARLALQEVGDTGAVAGLDVNPGMLEVARSATPSGDAIEWHQASAESMPLPDSSFDVVLCQMGLQFLPDKTAALREMRRVLASDGRMAFNVPGPTPEPFAHLSEALGRHIGAEAAGFVRQVFSLHDEGEIGDLVTEAGFHEVSVRSGTAALRLPAPKDFLWQYVSSTPLAGVVAQAGQDRRGALERDVLAGWRDLEQEGALTMEVRNVVVTARS
jgi:ubiquinone/menaquinone biosynthesis C-methylase UbiE